MARLITSLPAPEAAFLRGNRTTILDWGCATGEGVALLAGAFSLSRVTGIDIAESAVKAARARHSRHEFLVTDGVAIPRPFDVIVTSNVLEHFERPLDTVRQHLSSCRLLYLALVPLREYPPIEDHLVTFIEKSFPQYLGGFVRLVACPVVTDPEFWSGQQVLVAYGSREYLQLRPGSGSREVDSSSEAYFRAPPETQAALEELATQEAEAETRRWVAAERKRQELRARVKKLLRRLAPRGSLRDFLLEHLMRALKRELARFHHFKGQFKGV